MEMKLRNVQGFIYSHSQKKLIETPLSSARSSKRSKDAPNPLPIATGGGFINKQPRPEPKTENQHLKILNRQYLESRIFAEINVRNVPDYIIKDTRGQSSNFKIRRKKPPQLIDLLSDSDDDMFKKKKKRVDFYLDREIDGFKHIAQARQQIVRRAKDIIEWSGQDVLSKMDPYKVRLAISDLDRIRVWPYRLEGTIKKARVLLRKIMNSGIVEHGMTLCVLGNTVILSLDYYGASE
jgi:hypothetical protein